MRWLVLAGHFLSCALALATAATHTSEQRVKVAVVANAVMAKPK